MLIWRKQRQIFQTSFLIVMQTSSQKQNFFQESLKNFRYIDFK